MPRPDAFHAFSRAPFGAIRWLPPSPRCMFLLSFVRREREALMANVSLSCRMVGFSAYRSFLLYLLFFPLSLSHPLPRSVFLSKDSGHYLEENFLFSPATTQRNSTVHVDCWRTGVASVEMGRGRLEIGKGGEGE